MSFGFLRLFYFYILLVVFNNIFSELVGLVGVVETLI